MCDELREQFFKARYVDIDFIRNGRRKKAKESSAL